MKNKTIWVLRWPHGWYHAGYCGIGPFADKSLVAAVKFETRQDAERCAGLDWRLVTTRPVRKAVMPGAQP